MRCTVKGNATHDGTSEVPFQQVLEGAKLPPNSGFPELQIAKPKFSKKWATLLYYKIVKNVSS